jgi:hypothetical protein
MELGDVTMENKEYTVVYCIAIGNEAVGGLEYKGSMEGK